MYADEIFPVLGCDILCCRYCKFDTFTPAVEKGLPVTRVISRVKLQEILSGAVGSKIIENGANVVDFVDHGTKVSRMDIECRTWSVIVSTSGSSCYHKT